MTKPELIKKLREMTQAGIMDVKKALDENNDDLEKAAEWLREKGIAKAAKKASAIAAEGITSIGVEGNKAVILEINSQTDFVAKNEMFLELASAIKAAILTSAPADLNACLQVKLPTGNTVEQACTELTSKIGEKIVLRRFQLVTKDENDTFGAYEHFNKKIAVLLVLANKVDPTIGKNVAMHAAAMAPKFMDRNSVDQVWLENESKILKEQTIAEGKPADKAEMIVKGRINKSIAEVCLTEQNFVIDPSKKINEYLKQNNTSLKAYYRYEVGEGIEKKIEDFAAEVASQMK